MFSHNMGHSPLSISWAAYVFWTQTVVLLWHLFQNLALFLAGSTSKSIYVDFNFFYMYLLPLFKVRLHKFCLYG